MDKTLNGFKGLQAQLRKDLRKMERATRNVMQQVADVTQKHAKAKFGKYQNSDPPFGAWPQLSPITQRIRESQGFAPNKPLLRTGTLRDSVLKKTGATWAEVGSNDPVMVVQEVGNDHVPPRPVFGPTLMEVQPAVMGIIDAEVGGALGVRGTYFAPGAEEIEVGAEPGEHDYYKPAETSGGY